MFSNLYILFVKYNLLWNNRRAFGFDIDNKYINIARDTLLEKFEDPDLFELINVDIGKYNFNP